MFSSGWSDPVDVAFGVLVSAFGLLVASFGVLIVAYALTSLRAAGIL